MPKTKKTDKTEVAEDVVQVTTDIEDDDGGGELDEIFADAVGEADLEEGGEEGGEDDDKAAIAAEAGEVVPAEEPDPDAPEPKDAEAQPGEEGAEDKVAEAPAAEPVKEEPTVEQPTVEIPEPIDPEKVAAEYTKWRGDAEELLATQHYNMTPEQAEEFDTDPGTAIPKLAARLHMEVMQQSVAMMARLLPQVMANVSTAQTQQTSREDAFFGEWPELKGHRDQVVRLGNVYMQLNPQATVEEFNRDVGAQVAVSMKVDLSGRTKQQPVETPREAVHTPLAAQGGAGNTGPATKPGTFEQLYEDAEAYDRG